LTGTKSSGIFTKERLEVKSDRKRWDERYKLKEFALGKEPNPFLKRHFRSLPGGKALDLATGDGRNAVFLALHGYDVDAVDISEVGLRKARKLARAVGVKINTIHADLDVYSIKKEAYDLIADFYFLNRRLIPKIRQGLKKGGRAIFETYLLEQRELGVAGPRNPRYFLKSNELLKLFNGFQIRFYREGIFREGGRKKAVASLVAQKI
jgi:tellurite methyltransferase